MTSTPSKPNLALIGAGYWGKNLARNFHSLGVLHTICDNSSKTLDSYGDAYKGVQKSTELRHVFENPAITQVAIAAPAVLHFQLAKAALEAGKDVVVEKPICLDVTEARALVSLAEAKARVLMVVRQRSACAPASTPRTTRSCSTTSAS